MAGGSRRDSSQAKDYSKQLDYAYAPASLYQSGSPLHNPYDDATGYARPSSATAKQIRRATSLKDSCYSSTAGLSATASLPQNSGLTRSQLAEQKHISRQSSISDSQPNQPRPASAERSRPSSASMRSSRESLSRESSSKRLSSMDMSQFSAAELSKSDGSAHRHSMSRAGSRPASPGPRASQTIPAYNPSYGRSTLTGSNSNQPFTSTSRQSLGSSSFQLAGPAALRRSSTGDASAHNTYVDQASHPRGLPLSAAHTHSNYSAGASQRQDFLGQLEEAKDASIGSSLRGQPRRSNSNPKAFLEMGGQFVSTSMASLGDKLRRCVAKAPSLTLNCLHHELCICAARSTPTIITLGWAS